jgi:two-component system LytT family sensor kinase
MAMPIERVIEDKRRLFWLLQLGGWSSWAATFYLSIIVWGEPPELLPLPAARRRHRPGITLALRWLYRRHLGPRHRHARLRRDRRLLLRRRDLGLCRSVIFYNLFPDEVAKLEAKGGSPWPPTSTTPSPRSG